MHVHFKTLSFLLLLCQFDVANKHGHCQLLWRKYWESLWCTFVLSGTGMAIFSWFWDRSFDRAKGWWYSRTADVRRLPNDNPNYPQSTHGQLHCTTSTDNAHAAYSIQFCLCKSKIKIPKPLTLRQQCVLGFTSSAVYIYLSAIFPNYFFFSCNFFYFFSNCQKGWCST